MKPQIICILLWDNIFGKMHRKSIVTITEARQFVNEQFLIQGFDHVFGQVVYSDDSRKDIFPSRRLVQQQKAVSKLKRGAK